MVTPGKRSRSGRGELAIGDPAPVHQHHCGVGRVGMGVAPAPDPSRPAPLELRHVHPPRLGGYPKAVRAGRPSPRMFPAIKTGLVPDLASCRYRHHGPMLRGMTIDQTSMETLGIAAARD